MTKYMLLLLTAAVILLFSCATQPSAETDTPIAVEAVSNAAEVSPEEGVEAAESETGSEGPVEEQSQPDTETFSGTSTDKVPDETVDGEGEAPPRPEPLVSPAAPGTGEEVTIILDSTPYETVIFEFGSGPVEEATHFYSSFGVKSVVVTAASGDWTGSAEISFPVTGSATLKLAADTAEHDASGRPVIEAVLEGEGDFDTIVVFENGGEILRAPRPAEYKLPVPFVGERTFTASLFEGEIKVADVSAVTITGLNSPPDKPRYEGEKFLNARPGEEISFTVMATDPNNDLLAYEIKFAPDGVVFDSATGDFSWIPTRAQRGVYLLHITAVDQPYGLVSPFVQRGIIVQ